MVNKQLEKTIGEIKKGKEEEELEVPEYEEEKETKKKSSVVERMKKAREAKTKKEEPIEEDNTANQIALLHNDGVYRLEMIYQLQQLNAVLKKLYSLFEEEEKE